VSERKPSILISLIPIVFLIILLSLNVYVFGDDATGGANQLALLMSSLIAALLAVFYLKQDYIKLEAHAIKSIMVAMQANIILLVVGMLIALWIFSGIVPTMIYYGVTLINPTLFLPVTCIICAIVSVATGSSWSTGGTVGIALLGIGKALEIPVEMSAGAIISGAYFGDKMSPLSETTNLAPAVSGSHLFDHIKHMLYSLIPSMLIACLLFLVIGLKYQNQAVSMENIVELKRIIAANFNVSLISLIVPLVVFIMVAKKIPALPAMLTGCLMAIMLGLFLQQEMLARLANSAEHNQLSIYKIILKTAYAGFSINTGNALVDDLFSRGGMSSMLNTVWLIIMAMLFSGMLEASGMLKTLADGILSLVKGVFSLVAATISSAIFLNITASDQYLAIVVSGKMFKSAYKKYNLAAKNLSRAVEDGATVTSVLVPWNTCGAYFASVLGVATSAYLPYCFFNLCSPLISLVLAATGWSMVKLSDEVKNLES
jgi:NhaC family Na+:H+ antiporter